MNLSGRAGAYEEYLPREWEWFRPIPELLSYIDEVKTG